MKSKVAIIGHGYVGKAMLKIFPDAMVYDTKYFTIGEDGKEHFKAEARLIKDVNIVDKETVNKLAGLAIVCVPTPMVEMSPFEFREVDTSIVEATVNWLQTPLILIKSTIPPETTDRLKTATGKRIVFSPEYVGEGKYQISEWKYMSQTDPRTHEFQIFGGSKADREAVCNYFVKKLGPEKFYYLIEAVEAEVIKYMENSWGAMKVIFAQEFYDLCQKLGASYPVVREGWALDNRVERMHTAVFVDERGFGGKCYPKDLNGIVAKADQIGVDMSLIKTVLRKNRSYASGDK